MRRRINKVLNGLQGHGIHRIRTNQLFCIQNVAIGDAVIAVSERHGPERNPARSDGELHGREPHVVTAVVGSRGILEGSRACVDSMPPRICRAPILAVAPRPGLGIDSEARRRLDAMAVDYVEEPLNRVCPQYGSANRVFAAAWAEGCALELDAALALATERDATTASPTTA